MSAAPCPTCPWRVGSDAHQIPNFDIVKARGLACTVGDGDDFRTIMACHHSPEGGETPCRGYLAVEGYTNLSVRLSAARGEIDLPAVWEAAESLDLFQSFGAMLADLERQFS